jgi:uncharacterized protein YbaR (Trm112 family)
MILEEENLITRRKLVPVLVCPQFRHRLYWERTQTSAVKKPEANRLGYGTVFVQWWQSHSFYRPGLIVRSAHTLCFGHRHHGKILFISVLKLWSAGDRRFAAVIQLVCSKHAVGSQKSLQELYQILKE